MMSKVVKSTLALTALGAFLASPMAMAQATNLKEISEAGSGNIFSLMGLLFAGSSVLGFFLVIVGILYFKKDRQQQNQGHGATGALYLGVGVALLAVVFIINIVLNSFGGNGGEAEERLKSTGWSQG